VLPLLPAYLSYVSGLSIEMVAAGRASPRKLLGPTLVFVAGFTTIFVALGTTASLAGSLLSANRQVLTKVSGGLILLMGLAFLGLIPLPWLYSERRPHPTPRGSIVSNYVLGLSFGLGWTPCIGPTLAAMLVLASQEATAARGALLLAAYSLGLGVPFMLAAVGIGRLAGALKWLRKHQGAVMRVSGGILVAFGVLVFFDRVYVISNLFQKWMLALHLDKLVGI
jgi:cytochrome c-type biogenesis protein